MYGTVGCESKPKKSALNFYRQIPAIRCILRFDDMPKMRQASGSLMGVTGCLSNFD